MSWCRSDFPSSTHFDIHPTAGLTRSVDMRFAGNRVSEGPSVEVVRRVKVCSSHTFTRNAFTHYRHSCYHCHSR